MINSLGKENIVGWANPSMKGNSNQEKGMALEK